MLRIEEYIAKRKKEDRLKEFDLNLRDINFQRCLTYVFEYFTSYLNSLEEAQKKIRELDKKENEVRKVNNQSAYLTIKEVSDILNLSRWTLTKLIDDGKLKAIKIEKQYRFRKSDIDEYLKSCEVNKIN